MADVDMEAPSRARCVCGASQRPASRSHGSGGCAKPLGHKALLYRTPSRVNYDELLGAPGAAKTDETYERATASYSNLDDRFRTAKRSYDRQYAQLYYARLMTLRPFMEARVQHLWPGIEVTNILSVPENKEVAVIGTLYKDMKLKPSILDEYTKDRGLKAALGATNFCSDDDNLILEDDGARMVLSQGTTAALAVEELVTGVVLAVRGTHEPGGDFMVNAVCYAGLAPQPTPLPRAALECAAAAAGPVPSDKYIALMSGLCLGSVKADNLQVQLALDFLSGNLGSPAEQQLASRVVRLVVAGGGIGQLEALAAANPYSRQQQSVALQPVKDLDMYLSEVAAAMPVEVMPGSDDPANVALPQQPIHRCLFPGCSAYGSFIRCTNPHEMEVDGVRLLGTSGQNVDDVSKYCRISDRLAMMERSLEWRHIAPTAPDTLACYPFHDNDPFMLDATPHVYFVGNQPEFATRLVQQPGGDGGVTAVRLVAVPSFARTGTIVLLNLRTLHCHPVRFDGSMAGLTA